MKDEKEQTIKSLIDKNLSFILIVRHISNAN